MIIMNQSMESLLGRGGGTISGLVLVNIGPGVGTLTVFDIINDT